MKIPLFPDFEQYAQYANTTTKMQINKRKNYGTEKP